MPHPYQPDPMDTSCIALPPDLAALTETMARNTHDIWAKGRMQEGWVYGETLNRDRKTHPDLVDYNDLPESEKDYDRNTAIETLKLILKLGYTIRRG